MLVVTEAILGNRKHPRVNKSIDIIIDGQISGRTTNIGMGGLYATINKSLNDIVDYIVELKLPDRSIFINGTTLRTLNVDYECYHTAICFDEKSMSDEDKQLLEDFLEGRGQYDTRKQVIRKS